MLSVMSENRGHAAILRCSGRIVAGEEAWTLYNTVISQQNKRVVVLDLTRVSRVDAGGLGVLASLERWARVAGVRLQVIPSHAVQEVLDLTGLGSALEVRPSVSAPSLPVDPWEDSAIGIAADDCRAPRLRFDKNLAGHVPPSNPPPKTPTPARVFQTSGTRAGKRS